MARDQAGTHRTQQSHLVEFTLIRRKRRTLAIRVRPDGTIEVRAPLKAPLSWIRDVVSQRAQWIEQRRERLAQLRRQRPEPRFVAGEPHTYLGRQYQLAFAAAAEPSVTLAGDHLLVRSPGQPQPEVAQRLIASWFANQCRRVLAERLEQCLLMFPDPSHVRPVHVTIRQMISRWGSMSTTGRMSLNSRLIHAPVACIDYVIVHELCHRLQPNHGPGFWRLVAEVMPDYASARARLKQECLRN